MCVFLEEESGVVGSGELFLRIQIFGAHRVRIFWNFKRSLEAEKVGDFVGWAFFLKGWLWLVGLVVVGQFVCVNLICVALWRVADGVLFTGHLLE